MKIKILLFAFCLLPFFCRGMNGPNLSLKEIEASKRRFVALQLSKREPEVQEILNMFPEEDKIFIVRALTSPNKSYNDALSIDLMNSILLVTDHKTMYKFHFSDLKEIYIYQTILKNLFNKFKIRNKACALENKRF